MTGTLAQIWRHPIKAHGTEPLERTLVEAGRTLPWDRAWAVTHEASKAQDGTWARCANFSRGAKAPKLMAIGAGFDEDSGTLTLSHPATSPLAFQPDDETGVSAFLDWIQPLMPVDRASSTGIIRATAQGMTDTDYPSISLGNLATLRTLSQRMGTDLDPRRFRMNFWADGLGPWEEFEWVGKKINIGDVTFRVEDQITRCASTMANPDTGIRDADPPAALLANWGHEDLGVALVAESSGQVGLGDEVALTA